MKIQETDLILNPDGSVYHLNLLPEHISDKIITVGDPTRVHRVSEHFDSIESEINKREFVTHVGTYKKKRITVISSGIGTDNVEILLTELDALANINLKTREVNKSLRKLNIVRVGTSGAMQDDIPVGAHLVSDFAIGLDNLMAFYELQCDDEEEILADDLEAKIGLSFRPYVVKGSSSLKRQIGTDMLSGNTVTCPGFYCPQGRKVRNQLKYPFLLENLSAYYHKLLNFRLSNFEMETSGYYALGRLLGHEILSVNAIIANRVKNQFAADPNRVVDTLIEKVLDRI
jgi:uridine phosphorylase